MQYVELICYIEPTGVEAFSFGAFALELSNRIKINVSGTRSSSLDISGTRHVFAKCLKHVAKKSANSEHFHMQIFHVVDKF